ncbi:MAG: MBL fold metallo-hydrolase [Cyanobacteriota bacterium]|nr:MBL fold metallo-hydrolase [Cyanobacteriota bacterium]
MKATYFGANGWLLEIAGLRVLLDPWLVGPLNFGGAAWLIEGHQPHDWPVPTDLDLLLLTQGLADHAHPETLALLPKTLPVLGSAGAVVVARRIGFTDTTVLRPGEVRQHGNLQLRATAGAAVPQIENGYLLEELTGLQELSGAGASLYVEPHGFLDRALPARPVTAVITPVVDLALPVGAPFVRGRAVVPELLERFTPAWLLASSAGGGVRFDGLLNRLLRAEAAPADLEAQLARRHPPTRFVDPDPGHCYELSPR